MKFTPKQYAQALHEALETTAPADKVFDTFYGAGGVTRWGVTGNGEVRFSGFHEQVEPRTKTKKAEELGFEMF